MVILIGQNLTSVIRKIGYRRRGVLVFFYHLCGVVGPDEFTRLGFNGVM